MKKKLSIMVILVLMIQVAIMGATFATHTATVQWVKNFRDDPTYPWMNGGPDEYFWNGMVPKWINFTVTNNGPNPIKEIKIVFQKYSDGSSMFNFTQTWQSKAGWYATPDEFGLDKCPTVLYFRTDTADQYMTSGETVTFSLFMWKGPGECQHNIDVWTVDAGQTPTTDLHVLYINIDQHDPIVHNIKPTNGTVVNGQQQSSVEVDVSAHDSAGPHLAGVKNVTLWIKYNLNDNVTLPNGPSNPTPIPDRNFTMKYNPIRDLYYVILTPDNGLVDEAWHNWTAFAYDYAENGPAFCQENWTQFFWFMPTDEAKAKTVDPCFLFWKPVGHVGGNAIAERNSGFNPDILVTATFNGKSIGQATTDHWGRFLLNFVVPEFPHGKYSVTLTDSQGVTVTTYFTIIPWMQIDSSSQRSGPNGTQITVQGTGFASSWNVNVIYRDVSTGNSPNTGWTNEWSDDFTDNYGSGVRNYSWSPYLDDIVLGSALSSSLGTFKFTFNTPESHGGYHPVYGQEWITGVRSGWFDSDPHPYPENQYPQSAFVITTTKVWTIPTAGLSDQYIQIFATGLPLPKSWSWMYFCSNKATTTENHDKRLALDFGPNKYWVFEKGFILNNQFDLAWSLQLYLPFAYWFNHDNRTSPTWNGNLYWVDAEREYHTGSQFLKIPMIAPGNYVVSLYQFDTQTQKNELNYLATTNVDVAKDPLYVRATSGTLYFKGENVTVYAEIDLDGTATNPTDISFQLYNEDQFMKTLTSQPVAGVQGLYVALFTCPQQTGNYFVKVSATKDFGGSALNGFGVTSFTANPTLDGLNAMLTNVNDGIATINTKLGTMTVDLNDVKGNITGLSGNVATITTNIGTLQTDIATIKGKVVSLEGNMATVQTDVGTLKTTLDSIGATVTATGADTVTIKTAVGDIQGKITSIDGKTTNIETSIGQVSTSTESIKTQTGLQPAGIGLSLVGALAAIIAAVLIFRKLYK